MKQTKLSYREKLLDPRWQKKRLKILTRDNWTCQMCGATDKTLHAHHIIYNTESEGPWDYQDDLIVTLCSDCHEEEHSMKEARKLMLAEGAAYAGFRTYNELDVFHDMMLTLGRAAESAEAFEDFMMMVESHLRGLRERSARKGLPA